MQGRSDKSDAKASPFLKPYSRALQVSLGRPSPPKQCVEIQSATLSQPTYS